MVALSMSSINIAIGIGGAVESLCTEFFVHISIVSLKRTSVNRLEVSNEPKRTSFSFYLSFCIVFVNVLKHWESAC